MRSPEAVAAMLCPVCKVGLAMSAREGVEIDYCPQCRGVWLDRGELDKIIERSEGEAVPARAAPPPPPQQQPRGDYGRDYGRGDYHGSYRGKRKKSFLEELFD